VLMGMGHVMEEEVVEVLTSASNQQSKPTGIQWNSASNRPWWNALKMGLQRPRRLKKCNERKYRPWRLDSRKSMEAANSITLI